MIGGLFMLMLLIFGGLCLAHALRPRSTSSDAAGASQGEGENDPGPAMSHPARPGSRPATALYTRSGRSGDLLRAHRSERDTSVLGPTGAGVEQSAPALATQEGHR